MMLTTGQESQSTELLPLTVAEEFDTRPQGEAKAGRTWAGSPHINDSVESVGEDSEEGMGIGDCAGLGDAVAPAAGRAARACDWPGDTVLGSATLPGAAGEATSDAECTPRKTRWKAADERRGQTFEPWTRITVEVPSRLPASGQPAWREGSLKLVVDVETLQTTVDSGWGVDFICSRERGMIRRLAERLIRGAESSGEQGTETSIAGPATVPILPSSRET
ncbi:hypothetical protein CPLU01_01108 [Colletotrichum plurivorum]|uniref:Uncharacterized protein n=1 Tax=Colletotrichum plurivorum TaxID=2175906 RepID=A0A8H6NPY2_9PEZI|nr:hypothetical protein CPLU01_01108 [Colletotrichum plurivorum]